MTQDEQDQQNEPGALGHSEIESGEIALRGSIWMTVGGENFGGSGRVQLLAHVADSGSISQAARLMKMSYKAAWDAIDTMNHLAGEPLVTRVTGGKGGGGTRLTPRGEQLVKNFRLIEREHRRFVDALGQQAAHITNDYQLIQRMNMKTSARNQYQGSVCRVTPGAVNDEVVLTLAGGHTIVATVTRDSSQSLGLKPGTQAFALIKASSVIVATDTQGARLSARNSLRGTVSRLTPGAVNTEVVIELAGGTSVAATVTQASADQLGLAVGQPATALFKASSVIVGVF